MPTWASGIVTVTGNPENIKKFCQLFIFEDHNELKPKKYFARSFIHTTWKLFEEEFLLKDNPNEITFFVDFAWSSWSCLIEGYPQDFKRECITLKSACKKYNVKAIIDTEECDMCFEEHIDADKNDVKYTSKKMNIESDDIK